MQNFSPNRAEKFWADFFFISDLETRSKISPWLLKPFFEIVEKSRGYTNLKIRAKVFKNENGVI